MLVKVLKDFTDKYTKKYHSAGDKIDISRERLNELNSVELNGQVMIFVEEIKESKSKEVTEAEETKPKTNTRAIKKNVKEGK